MSLLQDGMIQHRSSLIRCHTSHEEHDRLVFMPKAECAQAII